MKVEEFIALLPQHFYPAFLGELVSIFGPNIFEKYEDWDSDYGYDLESGTSGWYHAFKQACIKIGQKKLCDYYNQFELEDCDEIDDIICKHFDNLTKEDYFSYFKSLFSEVQENMINDFAPITPAPIQGWICPKCGAVMAPSMMWCVNCINGNKVEVTTNVPDTNSTPHLPKTVVWNGTAPDVKLT